MHVFIDESGSFQIPQQCNRPSVSCIGALVVPSHDMDTLLRDFHLLCDEFPKEDGEIKGKFLNEKQMNNVLSFCIDRKVHFHCVGIDLSLHKSNEILEHKEQQADQLMKHITPEHQQSLIKQLKKMQSGIRSLSIPDYIQLTIKTVLVNNVLRKSLLFASLRSPEDIGKLTWEIDAKDKNMSRAERIWQTLSLGFLESRSIIDPWITLDGANFSYLDKSYMRTLPEAPNHLQKFMGKPSTNRPYEYYDLKLLMADMSVLDSRKSLGLQMCDVVLSCASRAMRGNLEASGWRRLGELMIAPLKSEEPLTMVRLSNKERRWAVSPPYEEVIIHVRKTCQQFPV